MGNCQAAEAAAVVIQHPGGKVERLHGAATAAEIMRGNPGHYVALVVLTVSGRGGKQGPAAASGTGGRITKVKLLKPEDTLVLGQVYRLITSQEVAKAIQARREGKVRRYGAGGVAEDAAAGSEGQERKRHHRSGAGGGGRGRHWQPSLPSISEAAS